MFQMVKDKEETFSKRKLGLDIIRVIAILFVFVTHAITYRGVMDHNVLSLKWTVYMVMRFMAMTCVPLFLLLTGYLNTKVEISRKYYKGIIPILTSYICISIFEIVANSFYTNTTIHFSNALLSIFDFSANTYAWYFEMYIGLFLLIPFLNILYQNLNSKREKQILVYSLAFLTFIPPMVKSFQIGGTALSVVPDYWQIVYPITYFFIGKMIREYQPKWNYGKRLALLVITVAIPTVFCYCFSTETQYAWYIFNGFEALTNAGMAIAIFLLFYDFNRQIPVVSRVVSQIAICAFEMYLFSSIWDKYLYRKLTYSIFIMVPIILVVTFISSKIWIYFREGVFGLINQSKQNTQK